MAVLVIAGSGRGAGKTAVGCALIAAIPELHWLAVKASAHDHSAGNDLWEEIDDRSEKDTGRYLEAGARRAFLIRGSGDFRSPELVLEARVRAAECDSLLLESNRIDGAMVGCDGEPAVAIAVVAGTDEEWKASLRERVDGMDALVLGNVPERVANSVRGKPVFRLAAGEWSVPGLVTFVRMRLGLAEV